MKASIITLCSFLIGWLACATYADLTTPPPHHNPEFTLTWRN